MGVNNNKKREYRAASGVHSMDHCFEWVADLESVVRFRLGQLDFLSTILDFN